nr:hypothetical protein [Pseudonocardia nigra]
MKTVTPSHIRHWLHGLTMARSYQRTIFANVSQVFTRGGRRRHPRQKPLPLAHRP